MSGVSRPNFIKTNVGTGHCPFRGGEYLFLLTGGLFLFFLSKVYLFLIFLSFLLFQQGLVVKKVVNRLVKSISKSIIVTE